MVLLRVDHDTRWVQAAWVPASTGVPCSGAEVITSGLAVRKRSASTSFTSGFMGLRADHRPWSPGSKRNRWQRTVNLDFSRGVLKAPSSSDLHVGLPLLSHAFSHSQDSPPVVQYHSLRTPCGSPGPAPQCWALSSPGLPCAFSVCLTELSFRQDPSSPPPSSPPPSWSRRQPGLRFVVRREGETQSSPGPHTSRICSFIFSSHTLAYKAL